MIRKIFKANTWLDVLKHIFIAVCLFAITLAIIFYIYLPGKTKQGYTITVPNVTEMEYEELDEFITSRELRYTVVADSGYNADLPPRAVISQYPRPDSKVKEGRKIYLTLNAVNPPKVEMPDLLGKSLKTVQLQLKAMGVKEGRYIFKPGPYKNTFVTAQIDGVDVQPGEKITKGSVVDLVLQNGKGQQYFSAPDVIGKEKESAEFIITGSSLNLGEIHYQVADTL
ncbi:MAG: PASTA domain-containing protein, partial [Cyclobacteriaceae bacterium]